MRSEIVSGVNPIYEVLRAGKRKVEKIWVAHKESDGLKEKILKLAGEKKISVARTSREQIFSISKIEKNQGIIARVSPFKYSTLEDLLKIGKSDPQGHFILVLDGVLDPQNLGSIIRSANLLGVHGVVIPERNSASISPASTRASAGAVEYTPVVMVKNIARTLELLKDNGVWIAGAESEGGKSLYSFEFSGSYAFVMGGEGKGIRRLVREKCDYLVAIPMNPVGEGVESYNVSVATAIILSEVNRQRRYVGG